MESAKLCFNYSSKSEMKSIIKIAAIASVALFSCEKNGAEPTGNGNITLEFDNRIGSTDLKLGETQGTNAAGEKYTISMLNYYVSNIKLTSDNGEEVSLKDQYFLIRESDAQSQKITLENIPAGNYTKLSYIVGVDSLKSVSDQASQAGVLDQAVNKDMYWAWNSGYIFFKMEGTTPVSTRPGNIFQYHVGGYGGRDTPTPNNLRTVNLSISGGVAVNKGETPQVHIILDITKVFSGENLLKLADSPVIMSPAGGRAISANYQKAFIVDHVHAGGHH
jgi:hypothetical protein